MQNRGKIAPLFPLYLLRTQEYRKTASQVQVQLRVAAAHAQKHRDEEIAKIGSCSKERCRVQGMSGVM